MLEQSNPLNYTTLKFLQNMVDQLIDAQFRIDDLQIVNGLFHERLMELDPEFIEEWENET